MSEVVSINSKIVSVGIKETSTEKPNIVVNTVCEKLPRPPILLGKTWKLKTPLTNSSMYITINDIILNEDTLQEVRRPFELFINSRDMKNYQWVVSLTRMISAILRKGGDISFIVKELLSVQDPNGGYLSKGKYIPSLVAEIGLIIEEHFKSLGIIESEGPSPEMTKYFEEKAKEAGIDTSSVKGEYCAVCGHFAVIKIEGCEQCTSCGASKCG